MGWRGGRGVDKGWDAALSLGEVWRGPPCVGRRPPPPAQPVPVPAQTPPLTPQIHVPAAAGVRLCAPGPGAWRARAGEGLRGGGGGGWVGSGWEGRARSPGTPASTHSPSPPYTSADRGVGPDGQHDCGPGPAAPHGLARRPAAAARVRPHIPPADQGRRHQDGQVGGGRGVAGPHRAVSLQILSVPADQRERRRGGAVSADAHLFAAGRDRFRGSGHGRRPRRRLRPQHSPAPAGGRGDALCARRGRAAPGAGRDRRAAPGRRHRAGRGDAGGGGWRCPHRQHAPGERCGRGPGRRHGGSGAATVQGGSAAPYQGRAAGRVGRLEWGGKAGGGRPSGGGRPPLHRVPRPHAPPHPTRPLCRAGVCG